MGYASKLLKYYTPVMVLVLMIPSVSSIIINETNKYYVESRIYNTTDQYIINWSEDGQQYTDRDNQYYGVRRVFNNTFWLKEMDPYIAQIIRVIDVDENGEFTKIGVTIIENPNDPNPTPDVPLRACVNGTTIRRGQRFLEETNWCEGDNEYYLERIPFNNEFIIEFVGHPESYEWWLGEGQGGIGNGVPTCEGNTAQISLNQTTTYVNETFEFGIRASYQGPITGCSLTSIEAQNFNDLSAWRVINDLGTNSNLNCDEGGDNCLQNPANYNTWYYKTVLCEEAGNRSVRTRAFGIPNNANSNTLTVQCIDRPFTAIKVEGFEVNDFTIKGNDLFKLYANLSFETTKNETITVFKTMNIIKDSGSQANDVYVNLTINGEEVVTELLRSISKTVAGFDDEGSTGIKPFLHNVTAGNHTILIYYRRTGNGQVTVNDIDLSIMRTEAENGFSILSEITPVDYTFNNNDLRPVFNFSMIDDSGGLWFYGKFTINSSEENNNTFRFQDLIDNSISPFWTRYLSDSDDRGSIAGLYYDSILNQNYSIYSQASAGTTQVNGSIVDFNLLANNENITGFQETNLSTNVSNFITLSAGTHKLMTAQTQRYVGNEYLIGYTISFKSASGQQVPTFFVNGSDHTISECFSKKERYLENNDDIGNAFLITVCENVTESNPEFNAYVTVESGESLIILDESLIGAEAISFDVDFIQPEEEENPVWLAVFLLLIAGITIVLGFNIWGDKNARR